MTHFSATEELFCANPHCLVGRWSVTPCADGEQLWQIISSYEDSPFLISAPSPICLCYGNDLLTPFEIDGGFAEPAQQEEGPLFDFIRQLQ